MHAMTRRSGRHCSAPTACVPRALRHRWDKTGAAKAAADKAAADKAAAEKAAAEKVAAEKRAAEKVAAERAAAERAAAEKVAAEKVAAEKRAADKAAAAKAAADKAAADRAAFFHNLLNKCGQCIHAPAAQRAAAIAASLAISGPATPPSPFTPTPPTPFTPTPPTSLAASRFMGSYNQPERKPDQLYALMTTDCHRFPERRAARYSRIGSS